MTDNPYKAPEAAIAGTNTASSSLNIENVASGQRLIIFGILLYFIAIAAQLAVGPIAGLLLLGTMVLGIIGIVRLASGFGYSAVKIIFLVIVMIIPLVGLLILLSLNAKATKELRASGYKVGLLGASKKLVV